MDVTNVEQAKIAEKAGACAVMALERVPADIRKDGGIARMSDPKVSKRYKQNMKRLYIEDEILQMQNVTFR